MLGGKNRYSHYGEAESYFFFIQDGIIDCDEIRYVDDHTIYTIEEFLEKFPYKVGDKVKTASSNDSCAGTIISMRWDDVYNEVIYTVKWDDIINSVLSYRVQGLQPYKKQEPMEETKGH